MSYPELSRNTPFLFLNPGIWIIWNQSPDLPTPKNFDAEGSSASHTDGYLPPSSQNPRRNTFSPLDEKTSALSRCRKQNIPSSPSLVAKVNRHGHRVHAGPIKPMHDSTYSVSIHLSAEIPRYLCQRSVLLHFEATDNLHPGRFQWASNRFKHSFHHFNLLFKQQYSYLSRYFHNGAHIWSNINSDSLLDKHVASPSLIRPDGDDEFNDRGASTRVPYSCL